MLAGEGVLAGKEAMEVVAVEASAAVAVVVVAGAGVKQVSLLH